MWHRIFRLPVHSHLWPFHSVTWYHMKESWIEVFNDLHTCIEIWRKNITEWCIYIYIQESGVHFWGGTLYLELQTLIYPFMASIWTRPWGGGDKQVFFYWPAASLESPKKGEEPGGGDVWVNFPDTEYIVHHQPLWQAKNDNFKSTQRRQRAHMKKPGSSFQWIIIQPQNRGGTFDGGGEECPLCPPPPPPPLLTSMVPLFYCLVIELCNYSVMMCTVTYTYKVFQIISCFCNYFVPFSIQQFTNITMVLGVKKNNLTLLIINNFLHNDLVIFMNIECR